MLLATIVLAICAVQIIVTLQLHIQFSIPQVCNVNSHDDWDCRHTLLSIVLVYQTLWPCPQSPLQIWLLGWEADVKLVLHLSSQRADGMGFVQEKVIKRLRFILKINPLQVLVLEHSQWLCMWQLQITNPCQVELGWTKLHKDAFCHNCIHHNGLCSSIA